MKSSNKQVTPPSPITLSGPSAVGKTTVGSLLAEKLGFNFFDLDDLVCKQAHLATSGEVIRQLGHAEFKLIQHRCLKKQLLSNDVYIFAIGGEVYRPGYDQELIKLNRSLISKNSYNIALIPDQSLETTIDTLYPRLYDGKRDTRTKDRESFLRYTEPALPQYKSLGNHTVYTKSNTPEEVVGSIITHLAQI